jgi:hypothetical protein
LASTGQVKEVTRKARIKKRDNAEKTEAVRVGQAQVSSEDQPSRPRETPFRYQTAKILILVAPQHLNPDAQIQHLELQSQSKGSKDCSHPRTRRCKLEKDLPQKHCINQVAFAEEER